MRAPWARTQQGKVGRRMRKHVLRHTHAQTRRSALPPCNAVTSVRWLTYAPGWGPSTKHTSPRLAPRWGRVIRFIESRLKLVCPWKGCRETIFTGYGIPIPSAFMILPLWRLSGFLMCVYCALEKKPTSDCSFLRCCCSLCLNSLTHHLSLVSVPFIFHLINELWLCAAAMPGARTRVGSR